MRPWDGSHVWFAYDDLPKTGNTFSFSFTYDPQEFYKRCIIRLSPNKRFIAVDSYDWDERGVLLLNTETGKLIADFTEGLTRDDFKYQSTPVWTLNNEMYSAIKGVLYRWKEAYGDRVEELLTLNEGKGTSYVTVNPQGTRVAFRYKKHLWVQNIDGSNLHQVTTSQLTGSDKADGEYHPVFSPDGKYIAFVGAPTVGRGWTDYDPLQPSYGGVHVVGSGYGYVFVIRDDDKLYELENEKTIGVFTFYLLFFTLHKGILSLAVFPHGGYSSLYRNKSLREDVGLFPLRHLHWHSLGIHLHCPDNEHSHRLLSPFR